MRAPLLVAAAAAAFAVAPAAICPCAFAAPAQSAARSAAPAPAPRGYFRTPALSGDTLFFAAEGDLWRVPITGGVAQRLTTHPAEEGSPAVSPDGKWLAFSASYEGPTEVYVLPTDGGAMPERLTFEGGGATVVGWTPDGRVLYRTRRHSTLPNAQLVAVDPKSRASSLLPLAQAADGAYDGAGKTLFFTRLPFQGSHAKRYKGGTAQSVWKWAPGMPEAVPLTAKYEGTSRSPMFWEGRVYFASDRDGVMNVWSMDPTGGDLKQHTRHTDYDVQSPALAAGKVAYQHGCDLWLLDLTTGKTAKVPVRLASDFDQMREKWVKKPMDWVTSVALSPKGDRVALTARGQVFVAPTGKSGRMVEATRRAGVRYRDARFLPDGKSLVALSDESGEVELWKLSAAGDQEGGPKPEQLTRDGEVLRWGSLPSPDGKFIAHNDKNRRLWLYDVGAKTSKLVASSEHGDIGDIAWSADSRHLAYAYPTPNLFSEIRLYTVETGKSVVATTDRYRNYSPAFSPDGKFLYFLSDRRFQSSVGSPWGDRQPEPYFDKQTLIFHVALQAGNRSPFRPDDEVTTEEKEAKAEAEKKAAAEKKPDEDKEAKKDDAPPPVRIDVEGLTSRLEQVPVPAGNYYGLQTDGKRLYFFSREADGPASLVSVEIKGEGVKVNPVLANVSEYDLSLDRKKLLARRGDELYVFDAGGTAPGNLADARVNLDGWLFPLDPREEWRQMYTEAWRLHRDYVYDPNMHNVDWKAVHEKYRPLAERVTTRQELSDVLAQMIGELSLLHSSVGGGDARGGPDSIAVAALGARWQRDEAAGGYRIVRVYRGDPDEPAELGPLVRPGVGVKEGDVVTAINGVPTLSVPDAAALLRNQAGKQVRLRVLPGGRADAAKRDVIVEPVFVSREYDLRYADWELSRRREVEKLGGGRLGYVHLRAMGSGDISQWQRDFYPVSDRDGLIVDVRHNQGGNIDSWILEKLMRRAWMFWKPRVGAPYPNMQYAFRGPIVVLCDEWTSSDGEAFAEGFRRLGLGKVIGTRTWGGEVWLTGSNTLVDRGIATAAEFGVYGPEGKWLIEGRGVEPDIVVDNPPRAAFDGKDPQLEAAVRHLLGEIKRHPPTVPPAPPYPDKSFPPRGKAPAAKPAAKK